MAQALREPAQAYIYQPARNAMQSGKGKSNSWVLQYAQREPRLRETVMGWTASNDMFGQMKLEFETMDAAKHHAERLGMTYDIVPTPPHGAITPKSYADKFSPDTPRP